MTETIEQKALALVNEVSGSGSWTLTSLSHPYNRLVFRSLCKAIEQHEAFRREVSDALSVYQKADGVEERSRIWDALTRFIIPQPDPLVEVIADYKRTKGGGEYATNKDMAAALRAALAARGLKIVEDK